MGDDKLRQTIMTRRDDLVKRIRAYRKTSKPVDGGKPVGYTRTHQRLPQNIDFPKINRIADDFEEAAGFGMGPGGIGKSEAENIMDSLESFTSEWYKGVRQAQRGGKYLEEEFFGLSQVRAREYANDIEKWLDVAAPYPKDKVIYRGLKGKRPVFDELSPGDIWDEGALSSFTSSKKIARKFSEKGDVVLELKGGADYGSSVTFVSSHVGEDEVLLSGRNVLRVVSKKRTGSRLYVTVEVDSVRPLSEAVRSGVY